VSRTSYLYYNASMILTSASLFCSFAAPEVLKGARYSGREQDVWALGVLGYVLICGECFLAIPWRSAIDR